MTVNISPDNATNRALNWTYDPPELESIVRLEPVAKTDNVKVWGVKAGGPVVLTATAADGSGVFDTCEITVTEPPPEVIPAESVSIEGETTCELGKTIELTAKVLPETATGYAISWKLSGDSVGSVDPLTGTTTTFTPKKAGEVNLTATVTNADGSSFDSDKVTLTVTDTSKPRKIDLTAAELDPLVSFTGPGLRYLDAAGTLQKADDNSWPLEYRNGVPVGRHEPINAAENVIKDTEAQFMTEAEDADSWLTKYLEAGTASNYHRLRIDPKVKGPITIQMFFKHLKRDYLALRVAPDVADQYKNLGIANGKITYTGEGIKNAAITDCGDGLYLLRASFDYVSGINGLMTDDNEVTTDDIPQPADRIADGGFYVGYPQIIAGDLSAPPLEIGESVAASSVTIDTSETSRMTVYYSDGTTSSYETPDASFTLPMSAQNWGSRYIQQIELTQD